MRTRLSETMLDIYHTPKNIEYHKEDIRSKEVSMFA